MGKIFFQASFIQSAKYHLKTSYLYCIVIKLCVCWLRQNLVQFFKLPATEMLEQKKEPVL